MANRGVTENKDNECWRPEFNGVRGEDDHNDEPGQRVLDEED